jgi:hypothetical protein
MLHACGFVHDETIDGPYRVVAIDVGEEMSVCYTVDESGDCIGRIGSTVFAVGWDHSYIVAAIHPGNDRSQVAYYYIVRALDGPLKDPGVAVRGPFSAEEFRRQSARLGLPALKRRIWDTW